MSKPEEEGPPGLIIDVRLMRMRDGSWRARSKDTGTCLALGHMTPGAALCASAHGVDAHVDSVDSCRE